ncbi:ComEC/Rec2 family competence protein [Paramicrobacterium sp. CJ85]|uniref:ComEC/Rec2 family competence protein n=1 Tax=Paramicrobacterium sp. CJ85 TaxID=3445355 RepID=UPI003F63027D
MHLLIAAACAWAAALVTIGTSHATVIWVLASTIGAVAVTWCVLRRIGGVLVVIAISCLAVGLVTAAVAWGSTQRMPEALDDALEAGHSESIHAVVDALPAPRSDGGVRLTATLVSIDGTPVRVPTTVFLPETDEDIDLGSRVEFAADLMATDAFDRSAALLFADAGATVISDAPTGIRWANEMRHAFADLCTELPGAGGMLLPGLAVGDTSQVSSVLDEAMKDSSLSHLTAVSGANCAIIVAFAMFALARCGVGRGLRVAGALCVLAAFVILVTPQASVVRASVMASLALVVHLTGRASLGVPVLSLSVLCLLIVDPWYAVDIGFTLSVLATAGLLLLSRPMSSALSRFLPRGVATLIGVPLAAQLACQSVLILLSSSISVYGVAANILAAPAAPVGTVVGLVACLLTPVLPALAHLLIWIAFVPASWIGGVATVMASLPGAKAPWLPGILGAVVLAAGTALAIALILSSRFRHHPLGAVGQGLLCVSLGVYLAVAIVPPAVSSLTRPAAWLVAACDVGQGDAVFIRSSDAVILIDTGPSAEPLEQCMTELGIVDVDLLVLTHYDLDHVGGLDAVAAITTTAFVQRPAEAKAEQIIDHLKASGASILTPLRGRRGSVGDIDFEVLWPPDSRLSGNPGSIVLALDVQNVRMLFLGDLGEESQRALLSSNPGLGTVDIVKVAHHGSSDQSAELYQHLSAEKALISVGADNSYGHPGADTLSDLIAAGSSPLRTDLRGTILLTPDREGLSVWSEEAPRVTSAD